MRHACRQWPGGPELGGPELGGPELGGELVACCATLSVIDVPVGTTVPGFGLIPITVPGVVSPVAGTYLIV